MVFVTAAFLAAVLSIPAANTPLGDGWMRYLRNAWVLDSGAWERWLRWRAPGHAWLVHALIPVSGSLVGAARLVGIASTTALIPLTWAIGRLTVGRWSALLGMLVLAGWADLRVLALQTTSYSLFAVLVTVATLSALHALRRTAWLGLLAGLSMGLAWGTDLRGSGLTVGLAVLCALCGTSPEVRRRGPLTAAAILLVAVPVAQLVLHSIPISLYPLSEQVAQQRVLNASRVGAACHAARAGLSLDWIVCLGQTTALNLRRLDVALPGPALLYIIVGLIGAVPRSRASAWRPLLLLALAAPALASGLMIPIQHRYLTPVAPLLALLFGLGLWRLVRFAGPRLAPVIALAAAVGLAAAWQVSDDTLLARVEGRADTEGAPAAKGVGLDPEMARLVTWLEVHTEPGDRVVDCARAELTLRMYPRPAESPAAPAVEATCRPLYGQPPAGRTWLLAPESEVRMARRNGWRPVERFGVSGGAWLLEGG